MTLAKFAEYIKIHLTWKDKPDKSTPILGEHMMTIESGIKANNEAIQELAAAVLTQIVNDPNKIASMAALFSVNDKVDSVISDLANLLDRLSSKRTTVPNRLDREATVIQFYRSNGTVSVQMSFQLAWSISKDVADMICAIPTGFNPSAARWVNSDTSNTGKNIQFNVKQNENGVWCLYLTALENLTATDRINDSFMYQL